MAREEPEANKNVEVLFRLNEAFNEGGVSSEALAFFDADAVFEEPPEQPGASHARGREATRRMFTKFDEAWEEHRSEPEEVRVIDDERVLVLTIEHFRGRDGVEIQQPCGTIYTFRDGRIARMQSFWERKTALQALGLPE
jgi:ketosteroid isomerase-like protein